MTRHLARGAAALFLLVLTIACLSQAAHAGTANLSCSAPTRYTDGTSIPAGTSMTFKFYRGTSAAAAAAATTAVGTVTGTCAFSDTTAPAGTQFYVASATVGGVESARTSAVSIVIPNPTPEPPTGLTVVAVVAGVNVSPVYRILKDGTRGEQVAGFVDVGAPCTGRVVFQYRGQKYRRTDPATVTWWGTRPTTDVAAACG